MLRTIPVDDVPLDLTAAAGAIWAVSTLPTADSVTIRRVDPRFDAIVKTIRVPSFPQGSVSVAAGSRAVWVAPSFGLLTRLNPASNRRGAEIDVASSPTSVAVGKDAVWVGDSLADTVTVPTAVAVFSQFIDDGTPPREWAERLYNIRRWTPMPSGGHFPAAEEPGLLSRDIAAFFNDLGAVP